MHPSSTPMPHIMGHITEETFKSLKVFKIQIISKQALYFLVIKEDLWYNADLYIRWALLP